ncbi:MAG TPA: YggT family protein [Anaerolineaceae bacterium]|nr:YggT family protein [Anaerolineaceae bacterium]HNS38441.1 YggT family protein [Anaerolineaceae bacterium]HOD04237.1 YggT family protein [Anaerolineaceae bacterium]
MSILISIVRVVFDLLTFLVFVTVILSYFLAPYHPIRSFLDRIINPLLAPIRRIVRPIQGLDFSPVILLLLLQLLQYILVQILSAIR